MGVAAEHKVELFVGQRGVQHLGAVADEDGADIIQRIRLVIQRVGHCTGVFPFQLGAGPLEEAADAQLFAVDDGVLIRSVHPVDAGGLNVVKNGIAAVGVAGRPLVVAGGIIHRRNVHQLTHQAQHKAVVRVCVNIHIARHGDEVGRKVAHLPHKVGVVGAVLAQMQVGKQHDAQVFHRLIHRDGIKGRDEALVHLEVIQQDAAQNKGRQQQ